MKQILQLPPLAVIFSASLFFALCAHAEVSLTTVVTFDRTNGYLPNGMLLGKDGNLYGTLSYGGWYDLGTIFRITPDGKCVVLVAFDGANGSHPSSLIQGNDGNFYGTTSEGGESHTGSIFKMTTDGKITLIAEFKDDLAYAPWDLVQEKNRNLYGKISLLNGKSTFMVTLDGKLTMPATNGFPANNELLKAKDGNSYGTMFASDGTNPPKIIFGTVYRISPDGTRNTVAIFNRTNGANPLPDLVQGRDGNIYGVTTGGGIFNQGTVFCLHLAKPQSVSSIKPAEVNVPILLHAISNKFNFYAVDLIQKSVDRSGKIDEETIKTICGTNKTFRRALEYAWGVQIGHRPPIRPDGVTMMEASNAYVLVSLWAGMLPSRPINFYGRVIDENGQPVEGATAHFEWDGGITNLNPKPFTDMGKISADVTTDNAGRFSLTNAIGTELNVSVGKADYYDSRQNRGEQYFKYSKDNFESLHNIGDYFKSDSNHPVAYYLHKKGRGVDLIISQNGMRPDVWARVPKDNTPVKIYFSKKQGSATGQLEIIQNKPPFQTATNWSFRMSILEGGLVENQDEFQFEAPEMGYQPTVEYHFAEGETNWTKQVTKQFYIVFGQPRKYGWLRIESNLAQETIFLTYAINPTGSRNLEPQ